MMRVKLFTRYAGKVDYILPQRRFSLKVIYISIWDRFSSSPTREIQCNSQKLKNILPMLNKLDLKIFPGEQADFQFWSRKMLLSGWLCLSPVLVTCINLEWGEGYCSGVDCACTGKKLLDSWEVLVAGDLAITAILCSLRWQNNCNLTTEYVYDSGWNRRTRMWFVQHCCIKSARYTI